MKAEHASHWRAGLLVLLTLMGAQSALGQGYSPQTRILPPLDGANGRNTAVNASGTIAPTTGWIDYRFSLPGQRQIRIFGQGNVAAGVTPATGVSRWKILQNNRLDTKLDAGTYNLRVFRNPRGRTESFSFTIMAKPVYSNGFSPHNLRVPANNNRGANRFSRPINLGPGPTRAPVPRGTRGANSGGRHIEPNNNRPGSPDIFGGPGNAGLLRNSVIAEGPHTVGVTGDPQDWWDFSTGGCRDGRRPIFSFTWGPSVNVVIYQVSSGGQLRPPFSGVGSGDEVTPETQPRNVYRFKLQVTSALGQGQSASYTLSGVKLRCG